MHEYPLRKNLLTWAVSQCKQEISHLYDQDLINHTEGLNFQLKFLVLYIYPSPMAQEHRRPPPSTMWSFWKALQGTYCATVEVPPADLRDKWVLITGANYGIGREAAIKFAKSGANLVLACRQPPPHETLPEVVVQECTAAAREHGQHPLLEWWECDLADLMRGL